MKGLMLKDLALLKSQRSSYIVILLLLIFMLFNNFDPSFVVPYITVIFTFFVIGTISYDEYNNGFSFLFTLPINREIYVRSKYAFSLLFGLTTTLLSIGLSAVIIYFQTQTWVTLDWFLSLLVSYIMIYTITSIMIPLQLKYGSEKSRIMMVLFAISIFVIGALVSTVMGPTNAMGLLKTIFSFLKSLNEILILLGFVAIAFVILTISYLTSVKIMKNKQF